MRRVTMGWLFFMSSYILCHSSFHQYFTCICADVFFMMMMMIRIIRTRIRTGALSLLESEMPVCFHLFKK